MNYTAYCISDCGIRSYAISVPCFIGDGSDLITAAGINSFYECALSNIYGYMCSLFSANLRRGVYSCTFSVTENTDGSMAITLYLSARLLYKDSGKSICLKKSLTHIWKNGNITKKIIK